jgi:hypothetical protein
MFENEVLLQRLELNHGRTLSKTLTGDRIGVYGRILCDWKVHFNRVHIISIGILNNCHTSLTLMLIYYRWKSIVAKIITLQTDLSAYTQTKCLSLYFIKNTPHRKMTRIRDTFFFISSSLWRSQKFILRQGLYWTDNDQNGFHSRSFCVDLLMPNI